MGLEYSRMNNDEINNWKTRRNKMKSIRLTKLMNEIARDDKVYIFIIAFFSINVILWHLSSVYLEQTATAAIKTVVKSIMYYFAGLAIPLIILLMIKSMGNSIILKIYKTITVILYAVVFIVDIFLYAKFNSFMDQAKIEILLGTNPYTVKEFLSLYLLKPESVVGICIIIAIAIAFRKLSRKVSLNSIFKKKHINILVNFSIICFLLLGGKAYLNLGCTEFFLASFYRNSGVGRVVIDTYAAIKDLGSDAIVFDRLSKNNERVIEDKGDVPYVIFILGESTDRNKMSAYGYKNKTTPLLDERIERNETVLFTDTIACANYTSRAMQLIFSFYEKDSNKPWYEYNNIIDIFNKANYDTVWISNQTPVGRYGNMDKILSAISTRKAFTSVSGGSNGDNGTRARDDELLPLLDDELNHNSDNRRFMVIHLEGTHEDFRLRYPKEFSVFTELNEDGNNLSWNKVKAEYDNAVLYNDYIIDEIIKRFENKNAVVIYISDHGDEVYDGRDFVGHSGEDYGNTHMIEIPMFVWGSKKYWQENIEMKNIMNKVKDSPYSTDNLIHFILDIAKIKSTSYESNKSILSENNVYFSKPRMYGDKEYKR